MSALGVSYWWEKHTREVYGVMEIMVKFLYYYCWRVVSDVHKFGWILAHRVHGYLIMQPPIMVKLNYLLRCEHEATLAKPSKDMLMGSIGVVRPILLKSMVANLRHQSIINMNETKDSAITRQGSYNTMDL
jgi:hypothetical protein